MNNELQGMIVQGCSSGNWMLSIKTVNYHFVSRILLTWAYIMEINQSLSSMWEAKKDLENIKILEQYKDLFGKINPEFEQSTNNRIEKAKQTYRR